MFKNSFLHLPVNNLSVKTIRAPFLDMIIIARIAEAKPRVYKCSLCYLATEMVRSALRANQQLFEKSPCHISTKAGPFRAVVLRRRSNPQVLWSDIDFVAADQRQKVFHGKGGRKRERESRLWVITRRWIVKKGSRFYPSPDTFQLSRNQQKISNVILCIFLPPTIFLLFQFCRIFL